jgi:hypothetical protein
MYDLNLERSIFPGRYKYEDLALQVWGISVERVIYGYESCATLISA